MLLLIQQTSKHKYIFFYNSSTEKEEFINMNETEQLLE